MSLELAILGSLAEHPRSGYDLKTRCFGGPIAPFWTADQAQIYRTLDRLSDAGYLSVTRRRQEGRPDRRIYALTQKGLEALDDGLSTAPPSPPARDPFLLRLYFGAGLPDERLEALLVAERARRQARLEALRAGATELAAETGTDDRTMTLRQTAFEGALVSERASIDWLDDCIEAVRDGALPGSEDEGIGQRHLFGT